MKNLPLLLKALAIPLSSIVVGGVYAGAAEIETAKGMIIAGIINEKCTGHQPASNETQRQVRAMSAQGFDFEDIKRGFGEGIAYAEGTYPRNLKPPKAVCQDAAKMYRMSLRFIEKY